MAKKKKLSIEALADLIRANPGAIVDLDNDYWRLNKSRPEDFDEEDDDVYDAWASQAELCTSDDFGGGGCSTEQLLYALALIAGIEIEHV